MPHRAEERERTERRRGWIIYLLYNARPRPLELDALRRLLDQRNFPMSRRRLAEEIEYLFSLRLLKVGPANVFKEFDDQGQSILIQKYADEDRYDPNDVLCARLTAAGVNFQEGFGQEYEGIVRVE